MKFVKTLLLFLSILIIPQSALAYYSISGGAIADSTGFGTNLVSTAGCAGSICHGTSSNTGGGTFSISVVDSSNNAVTSYSAGSTYTVTVALTHSGATRYGFQARTADSASASSGTLAVTSATTTQLDTNTSYIEYKNDATGAAASSWSFSWTAPSTATNSVTFYAGGVAGNSNADATDDSSYTATKTLTVASSSSVSAPTSFIGAGGKGGAINLVWSAATGVSGYKLYYGVASGTYLNASTGLDLGNVTSKAFTGIGAGTYYVALKSYDSSGNLSSYSTEIAINISSTAGGVNFSWPAVTGATGYKLFYGVTSGTYLNASSGLELGNVTTKSFTGIGAGTYYLLLKSYATSGGTETTHGSEFAVTVQ